MRNRLIFTLQSFVGLLVTMFGLVPFVLTIVSVPLIIVWIGIPMLVVATFLVRHFVGWYRQAANRILPEDIVVPYRLQIPGGLIARTRWVLGDSATWRDLLWILVNCTAGFVLQLLPTVFLLGTVFYLIYPYLLAVTPAGVFTNPFGVFVLSHPSQGFLMWPVAGLLFAMWWAWSPGLALGWAKIAGSLLGPTRAAVLTGRVESLAASRADTVDSAAAEIRRIERDLHDGAQVKLVSLGMTLGLAEELMDTDPAKARQLLAEAAGTTSSTLTDLRNLVRGIHPPVLADRGLLGAAGALALESPLQVVLQTEGFGDDEEVRLPAPVEACAYFVVSEALANVAKHARAERVVIDIELADDHLYVRVTDDGVGGADPGAGSGLTGLERRVGAFDGTLAVTSPAGGPTMLTMEMPCEPLSPKTTPSSAKG